MITSHTPSGAQTAVASLGVALVDEAAGPALKVAARCRRSQTMLKNRFWEPLGRACLSAAWDSFIPFSVLRMSGGHALHVKM